MKYRQFDGGWIIRFEHGEKVMDTFHSFLAEQNITFGSFTGLGAVLRAEFGFYRLDRKDYAWMTVDEEMELASWIGNVSLREGKPFAHTHAVFCKLDGSATGGHVREAEVGATLEVVLHVLPGEMHRELDERIGLHLLCP